jgi:hypothetical protein
MTFCIVVARYNENINWCKKFSNVIVYNKGDCLNNGYNEILLPNVGREGHTYYKHICDNYDNLTDYTIFLQGNPFDHSPNIMHDLNKYINNPFLNINFEFLSKNIIDCNLSGCEHHKDLPLIETYEKIFGKRVENMKFKFGAGAQFIVSKKCILNRPKSFYSKIVELLENEINPIEGFVIERFHKIIFNSYSIKKNPYFKQTDRLTFRFNFKKV